MDSVEAIHFSADSSTQLGALLAKRINEHRERLRKLNKDANRFHEEVQELANDHPAITAAFSALRFRRIQTRSEEAASALKAMAKELTEQANEAGACAEFALVIEKTFNPDKRPAGL